MEITGFETYVVQPRWVFLKVETDVGIVGWGEPNLEGKAEAVLGALSDIENRLFGADPPASNTTGSRSTVAVSTIAGGF